MSPQISFSTRSPAVRYAAALSLCALTTLIALPLRDWLDLANIVMLFLLTVFIIAVRLGRGPAVLAAFFSVAAFDVFFVHPYLSLSVDDAQYLVTFAVMLAVGLIASHQTAQLVARTEEAKAREHAVQTEKLRASILSSISHDLRTPLTSLIGLADTLPTLAQPQAQEKARIIRDQAYAMHRMVTNLLDMARMQSGKVVLHKQWQPFDDVVGSSLRQLEDLLSGHPLETVLPIDLPLISFDAVLLERVLCNLLENAAKYAPPGARIRLSCHTAGSWLVCKICNEGPGFPPEKLDQVFELFTRGAAEPAIPGTGVGLAVCRAIITAHEGSIAAENRPGLACVRFTLPLGTPPALEGDAQ